MDLVRRPHEIKKILSKVHERYRDFVEIQNRVKSSEGRFVSLIRFDRFESFITAVIEDKNIGREEKALILITLSTGHRISEVLSLQRVSFLEEAGKLYVYSKVLKKRKRVERKSIIHPAAQGFVLDYIRQFQAFSKVFTISRHNALYAVKIGLGEAFDVHSFRHSLISYLLFKKKLTVDQVAELMKISVRVVKIYAHLNASDLLDDLFAEAA